MFSLSSLLLYLHQFQKSYLMRLQHQKTPQRKHFEGTKHSKTQIDSISFLPTVSMYWFDFQTHRSSTCCKHFQASSQARFVGKNKKLFAQVSLESIKWWSSQELSTHRFPWKGSMVKVHMKGLACNKYVFQGLLGGKDDQWWSWSLMQQVRWIHTCMSRKAKRKENRVLELQHKLLDLHDTSRWSRWPEWGWNWRRRQMLAKWRSALLPHAAWRGRMAEAPSQLLLFLLLLLLLYQLHHHCLLLLLPYYCWPLQQLLLLKLLVAPDPYFLPPPLSRMSIKTLSYFSKQAVSPDHRAEACWWSPASNPDLENPSWEKSRWRWTKGNFLNKKQPTVCFSSSPTKES